MTHALHLSGAHDWRTPPWLIERVHRVAPITLDPATGPENPVGAAAYYAHAPDPRGLFSGSWLGPCGLRGEWGITGHTWINPPYGPHLDGSKPEPDAEIWRKGELVGIGTGWGARIAAHEGQRTCLVPNRTEVAWFERLHAASDLRAEFRRRIPFHRPDGTVGGSPNHGSVLFYRAGSAGTDGLRRFVETFRDIARILPGGRV